MSTTCKYCNEPENKQDRPGLICDTCICFVHLSCLRRQGTPGDFVCDVFFDFTCADCSTDSEEQFWRNRFTWVNVLLLTLNHLSIQMQGISNHGFFHYKTHICSFVDRYWVQLFGDQFKQKKNWVGTIAGVLSVHSNLFFRSGSIALGESGWWQLQHYFSPAVAAHILQELARDRPKGGRTRNHMSLDKTIFIAKVTEMGYQDYLNHKPDRPLGKTDEGPPKKRRLDTDEHSGVSTSSFSEPFDSDMRKDYLDDAMDRENQNMTFVTAKDNFTDVESIFRGFQFTPTSQVARSDTSSLHSNKPSLHYDSDSHSSLNHTEFQSDDEKCREAKKSEAKTKKVEEKPVFRAYSLFSSLPNSTDVPWVEREPEDKKKDLVRMTEYEEVQLLKTVENLIPKVKDSNKKADLYRLKAKLALRRLKRHHHLPMFDLDKTVKLLGGYVTEDPRVVMNAERVLDRFQRSYLLDNLSGTISSTNYGTLLLSHIEPTAFRSPHSGTILKPYIRRDATTMPTWLKLRDELLRRTHRHIQDYEPPPRPTIDFSYVRPQHIAAVNSLCAQFFWPGIDLTEALQYPEFSCVVTFGRLVVGCAFLVPDAGGQAYVSFVLTRPEWRRKGLAAFMLYHLLQTCTDKDVTLHVSPTNPAIFLYQKFGFKVEELIQDFYEKYYDIDYKGCRHALFLRLVR
nr:cysteine-rich protein 2-binding protein [Vanessa tameamea]